MVKIALKSNLNPALLQLILISLFSLVVKKAAYSKPLVMTCSIFTDRDFLQTSLTQAPMQLRIASLQRLNQVELAES
jgi:hypothetical protein